MSGTGSSFCLLVTMINYFLTLSLEIDKHSCEKNCQKIFSKNFSKAQKWFHPPCWEISITLTVNVASAFTWNPQKRDFEIDKSLQIGIRLFLAKKQFLKIFTNEIWKYTNHPFPFLPTTTANQLCTDGTVPSLNKNFLLRCKTLCSILFPLTIQVHSELKRHYHICT